MTTPTGPPAGSPDDSDIPATDSDRPPKDEAATRSRRTRLIAAAAAVRQAVTSRLPWVQHRKAEIERLQREGEKRAHQARLIREQNIGFRADLNACAVLVNLLWESAWVGDQLLTSRAFPYVLERELLLRVDRMLSLLPSRAEHLDATDLLRARIEDWSRAIRSETQVTETDDPATTRAAFDEFAFSVGVDPQLLVAPTPAVSTRYGRPVALTQPVKSLVLVMRANVVLLGVAADELITLSARDSLVAAAAPSVLSTPVDRITQWDGIIAQAATGSTALTYQAACILSRRADLLTRLRPARTTGTTSRDEALQIRRTQAAGRAARAQATAYLTTAVAGSPRLRRWAADDPAFRHHQDDDWFRSLLVPPSEPPPETPATPPPNR